jgi:hypothetical protein
MIRLTVLYNLPPEADEAEFLRWRLGEHQASNAAMPGVVRTDFARIDHAWPPGTPSRHRFMTIAEWPDRASFEKGFYDAEVQAQMKEDVKKITDTQIFVTEILVSS